MDLFDWNVKAIEKTRAIDCCFAFAVWSYIVGSIVMIVMSKESENSAKGWKKLRKKKDLEVAKGYS